LPVIGSRNIAPTTPVVPAREHPGEIMLETKLPIAAADLLRR
jgi:hypothetical protein